MAGLREMLKGSEGATRPNESKISVIAWIDKAIGLYMQERDESKSSQQYVHASAMEGACAREASFRFLRIPVSDEYPEEYPNIRMYRHFFIGIALHEKLQEILQFVGVLRKVEYQVMDPSGLVGGSCDGVLFWKELGGEFAVWEFKTISPSGFAKIVKKPTSSHIWQLNVYMYLLRISKGVILYLNKATADFKEHWLEPDEDIVKEIKRMLKLLGTARETHKPVEEKVSWCKCVEEGRKAKCRHATFCWGEVQNGADK